MVKRKIPTFNEIKNWFSSGNADVSVNSLEADQSTIAGTGNRNLQWEHLDSANSGTSISLNVSDYSVYLVHYILQFDNVSGDNMIRFNGDSGTNYQYYDETGSKTTAADGIPFLTVNTTGYWRGGGSIKVFGGGDFDESGINHEIGGGRIDRLGGYADVGGWLNSDNISSIDFDLLANSEAEFDVWGLLDQT
jgi:Tfp pilus assembly major pilin PilA